MTNGSDPPPPATLGTLAIKACNSCGKCCIKYGGGGLSASRAERERWDLLRPDISRFVSGDTLWADPETGAVFAQCPFLRVDTTNGRYLCDIYFDRPDDCKFYPSTIEEMVRDGCEMIEPADLKNPKRARQELDRLMSDSRTPRESE